MATLNWLHLSDWHQYSDTFDRRVVREAILKDIRERVKIAPELARVDLVLFTGDLAYKGKGDEFATARQELLDPVLEALGLTKERLFLVPGNHDLDRDAFELLPQAILHPFDTEKQVQEWLGEPRKQQRLREPFEAYDRFVEDYGVPGFHSFGSYAWISVEGKKVGVLGVNSALMCARNLTNDGKYNDYGFLTVGEMQVYESLTALTEADVRIALIHHPFAWLQDFDRNSVESRLNRECHFILRGHEHNSSVEVIWGTQGRGVVVPGGACYNERLPERPLYINGYNFMTYDIDTGHGTVYLRRWSDKRNIWIADIDTFDGGKFSFPEDGHPAKLLSAPLPRADALADARLETARQKYLDFLLSECANIDPRGIAQTDASVTLPLDQVYVSLTAERAVPQEFVKHIRGATEKRSNDQSRGQDQKPAEVRRPTPSGTADAELDFRVPEVRTEKINLPRAIRESVHAVVLGDPGAGKTTLTKFLASRFALAYRRKDHEVTDREGQKYGVPRLPIRLRVAQYAEAMRADRTVNLHDFLSDSFDGPMLGRDMVRELFAGTFERGEAFVILDGLDEIANVQDRIEIARRIETFTTRLPAGNRVLVTSRIVGYREAALGGGFQTYTLRDMDLEQIGQFLNRWCEAVERFHLREVNSETIIQQRADAERVALLGAIQGSPGVRRLAGNPLLLTVLALIHRNIGHLPQRRVELYKIAAHTMLREWRRQQARGEAKVITEAETEQLLAPLAYWMHSEHPTGLITLHEAQDKLRQLFVIAHGGSKFPAEVAEGVEDFLRRVREHSGLFVERAVGRYGFLHLTFEEYFAACDIVSEFTLAPGRIAEHRHDPRWEEPIRLAIAQRSSRDAAHLIRAAVWNSRGEKNTEGYQPSLYEDILRRDLLLAIHILSDCDAIEPTLAQEVTDTLVKLCLKLDNMPIFTPIYELTMQTLPEVASGEIGTKLIQGLLVFLKDARGNVRDAAVRALGHVGASDSYVLDVLLSLATNPTEYSRDAAARALGQLNISDPRVINALLALLKDKKQYVRLAAVRALGQLSISDPRVINALLARLKDRARVVRATAASTLGQLSISDPRVTDALLALLKDKEWYVRGAVASALGQLGASDPHVIDALLALATNPSESSRDSAAKALGQLSVSDPRVIDALLALLKNEQKYVRSAAVSALGQPGVSDPRVIDALLALLKDKEWYVRDAVAIALGQLGASDPYVIDALLALTNPTESSRDSAAKALGQLGVSDPRVIDVLLALLKDKQQYVRDAATHALGQLGVSDPRVIDALLALLKGKQQYVRSAAAGALGHVGASDPRVIDALLTRLNDRVRTVRDAAAEALRNMAPWRPDTV